MKFDFVLQNPPYRRGVHLDFFKKGLDILDNGGKLVIVEPSAWLINVRDTNRSKEYDEIKRRIDGHVENVVIENLNIDFNTGTHVPFSITGIDMSRRFEDIDFVCCGDHRKVKSIYDCNLVGDYRTVRNILKKCESYGDVMSNHVTKEYKGDGFFYLKYHEMNPMGGVGLSSCVSGSRMIMENIFNNDIYYVNGYVKGFYHCCCSTIENYIKDSPHKAVKPGGLNGSHILSDKNADNVYGTREELENWMYYVFNNKLPLFLNIVISIDQKNNSKSYVPWIVDKKYTDDEIYSMLGLNEEEIRLIEYTLMKFRRDSPWFKRYICGSSSVSEKDIEIFFKNT